MSALPPRASLFPVGSLAPATAKSLWADFYDSIANFFGSAGHGFDGALLAAPRRVTFAGTADAITATLAPAITSYTTGMRVTGLLPGANTIVAPTLNLNAIGVKTIKKRSGTGAKVALVVGDYNGTLPFEFEYDGTDMILLNPLVPARADIASAATLDLSATSGTLRVTGTTTTTAVTLASGQVRCAVAAGAWPLTNDASLILPGAANYTCAAGDTLTFIGEPAGVVRVLVAKASGLAVVVAAVTPPEIVQVVEGTPYVSYSSTATTIPNDDTIPQITEGAEWATVTITPTSAGNRLRIEALASAVTIGSAPANIVGAIFKDSTADALAAGLYTVSTANYFTQIALAHEQAAGSTSAQTFRFRIGATSGTLYVNGNSSARVNGGVNSVRIRVTEIA